ncbi:MAG TPA: hypothetical protein VHQ43_07570 [Solirubrobacterales bacterium]|jgi:hypothetical protein|nr:hypothetical protein [Solirubrobacterales bacterium]
MAASLWATSEDRRRIARSRAAVLMVGSYDGSGNYGDVLQFAAALDLVGGLPGSPLPIALVERFAREHHAELMRRFPALLGAAAYVHYDDGGSSAPDDDLLELESGLAPRRSVLYLYGGGYMNRWWGARKVALSDAAERLAGGGPPPLVASGLQVDEASVAPGGVGHDLLSRSLWTGARGFRSLEFLSEHVGGTIELSGDDAVPALALGPSRPGAAVNFHFNDGDWVSDDPDTAMERVAALLGGLGQAMGTTLELQPVLAYEDPRIRESRALATFFGSHGAALRAADIVPAEPLDILEDAASNELARFRRGRLTVCRSYHVALSSLLCGIPTVLLAENDYYDQKALELRGLFELDGSTVGIAGTPDDLPAALEGLLDGPARSALTDHLGKRAADVVRRQRRGRQATAAALRAGLERGQSQWLPSPRKIAAGVRRRIARSPATEMLSM